MKIHTIYKHNVLKLSIKYNDRDDIGMNADLYNVDVSSGIVLINSHILSQFN